MLYIRQVNYTDLKLKWMNNLWKLQIPADILFIQCKSERVHFNVYGEKNQDFIAGFLPLISGNGRFFINL